MHAVVLRDIRSRFFDHGLGFLIVPLFPVVHIFLLLALYFFLGRSAPFGEDLLVFFATGLLPTISFMYVSRFMSMSLLMNKSMMAFPVVRLLDIVLARAFLEIVGTIGAGILIFFILLGSGSDPVPHNISEALTAMFFLTLLSIGMGIIASVITGIFSGFALVYGLSLILVYLLSGAIFFVHAFPEQIVYTLSWNPVFHAVEWMRTAFYITYPSHKLDKNYLIGFALGSLCVGLIMERVLRRQILEN